MTYCLASVGKLKNFTFLGKPKSWIARYVHIRTGALLEEINLTDSIYYFNRYYNGNHDLKVGQKIWLDNQKSYNVLMITDHRDQHKRVTIIYVI